MRLKKYATIDQLKTAIKNVFSEISQNKDLLKRMSERTWRKIELCAQNDGIHTDIIIEE